MDLKNPHQEPLRRLDWRFLLPLPRNGRLRLLAVPGASTALAQQCTELGLAERAINCLPGRAGADGVAILAGAGVSLERAAAALQPEGILYYEVDRSLLGQRALSPARTERILRRLGLAPTGFYAVRPSLEAAELYLPLDVPRALRWYVDTLYVAATCRQRLAEIALRAATGLDGRRFASLAPYYVVTAIAARVGAPSPAILDRARTMLGDAAVAPLLLTDGGNRVTVLPFARDGVEPLFVLKVPKLPSFNGRTENEQQALMALQTMLDGPLQASVPRPLGIVHHGPISISIESYCPGLSLLRTISRWGDPPARKVRALNAATDWLIAFHKQQATGADTADRQQWFDEPLAAYAYHFGNTPAELRLFSVARQYAASLTRALDGRELPLVKAHRDFNIWNLYQNKQRIHVIDWEGASPGPPLCDLIHFVTYWYLALTRRQPVAGHLEGFDKLFFGSERNEAAGRAAHEALARYMERMAIDRRWMPLMLVYLWVELALRRNKQQSDLGQRHPDPRQDNQFVSYIRQLAQRVEPLFGGALL